MSNVPPGSSGPPKGYPLRTEERAPIAAPRRAAPTLQEPFDSAILAKPQPSASAPSATTLREPGIHVYVTDAQGREQHMVFARTEVIIGRERGNDLVLGDEGVSRNHAMLAADESGNCTIVDLGSTNGTVVNHRHIENTPTVLHVEDRIALGQFMLRALYVSGLDGDAAPDIDRPRTTDGAPMAAQRLPVPPPKTPRGRAPRTEAPLRSTEPARASAPPTRPAPASEPPARNDAPITSPSPGAPAREPFANKTAARMGGWGTQIVDATERDEPLPPTPLAPEVAPGGGSTSGPASGGALRRLLDDPEVLRVQIRDRRLVVRGRGGPRDEGVFANDELVAATLARLCSQVGHDFDASQASTRATLAGGWEMVCLEDARGGFIVSFERHSADGTTLAALARAGAMPEAAVALIEASVRARFGTLVVGDRDGCAHLLAALCAACAGDYTLWLLAGKQQQPASSATGVTIADADTWRALLDIRADHVIAPALFGSDMDGLLDAIARGCEGVIASVVATNAAAATARLARHVGGAASADTARAFVAACFPLVLETVQHRDGQLRLSRITWLTAQGDPRSVWEGGAFTSQIFELLTQLSARGFDLDAGAFV